MPRSTLLSSIFQGLSQGANFAGQNYLPYKQQQERDARAAVVEGRQDELFDRGTEEYRYNLERRPTLEGRADELFNRGTTEFDQEQTLFDQGQEGYRHNLERRPIVEGLSDTQTQANIDRTRRLNTGPGGSTGSGRSDVSTIKDTRSQRTNALLDQTLSRIFGKGFAEEDSSSGFVNFFTGDSKEENLRDHLEGLGKTDDSYNYQGMGARELYNALQAYGNYSSENFPTIDELMKKALQYSEGTIPDIRELEALRDAENQPNPERAKTLGDLDQFRRNLSGQRQ